MLRSCFLILSATLLAVGCIVPNPLFNQDSSADGDADGDADADSDSDGDADGDSDGDADGDADADSDSDGDADGDADADGCESRPEECNGLDDDCDGILPDDEQDHDGDGFLRCEDCDDHNPQVHLCDCLIEGNYRAPNRIFVYDAIAGGYVEEWTSAESDDTHAVACIDLDRDGDSDFAEASGWDPLNVYYNDGPGILSKTASSHGDGDYDIAWGFLDADHDFPELAVARASKRTSVVLEFAIDTLANLDEFGGTADTKTVGWADWDGDGDLDLAIQSSELPIYVYENDAGSLVESPVEVAESANAVALAWGDCDGDGIDDLAFGRDDDRLLVHQGDGAGGLTARWSEDHGPIRSLAFGDWDGDGIDELAVGGHMLTIKVYECDGDTLNLLWESPERTLASSIAMADSDGDGLADIAVGGQGEPNMIFTHGVAGSIVGEAVSTQSESTYGIAWCDCDW